MQVLCAFPFITKSTEDKKEHAKLPNRKIQAI